MDPRTDTFADPAKVRAIDFEGTYYRSRGPLNATPSPQGRPVIIQAGTSERGQALRGPPRRSHHRRPRDARRDEAVLRCLQGPCAQARAGAGGLQDLLPGQADHRRYRRGGPAEADALYANAPVEAGLAALSTLLQIDLSTYELDQPLPASIQARAIQGIRSQLDRFYLSGRSPTLREIATRKVSLDSMPFIGTPQRVADSLARTIEAVGGDGFAIRQGLWPGYVGPFVEQVVPLLQQRGVARAEYAGTTLREHLREF